MQSATPYSLLITVWPLSLSLATTHKISVDFSSSPYLDVSVQEVPLIYLCIQYMIYELLSYGLLHSDICGSKLAYSSPQLFAVNHVLLRFPMPRHPPCALLSFTICSFLSSRYTCSFLPDYHFSFLKKSCRFTICISSYFSIQFSSCFFSILFREQKLTDIFYHFLSANFFPRWWAQVDSNHRPHAYQACALTT